MPLYDYQCTACGAVSEVRHGFDQTHEAPCPKCGGSLKRVFNPAPILFKGSGFYITDSRPKSDSSKSDSPKVDAPKADAPKSGAPAPSASKESAA